nr:hypothetical protein CFP56_69528 [Quercus suber]
MIRSRPSFPLPGFCCEWERKMNWSSRHAAECRQMNTAGLSITIDEIVMIDKVALRVEDGFPSVFVYIINRSQRSSLSSILKTRSQAVAEIKGREDDHVFAIGRDETSKLVFVFNVVAGDPSIVVSVPETCLSSTMFINGLLARHTVSHFSTVVGRPIHYSPVPTTLEIGAVTQLLISENDLMISFLHHEL